MMLIYTLLALALPSAALAQGPAKKGLTAVAGLKVGHYTLTARLTGCTVILTEAGAVAGVDVRGGAPGTRETDLLDPVNTVQKVHAVVLSGGSAFGLEAATGTVRWLEEKGIGFDVYVAKVPIVPAAILFDLGVGDPKVRPTAECGYKAAASATDGPVAEGNVGAGAGATIGKLAGPGRAMKAGLGSAALTLSNGLTVAALVAVNAVGAEHHDRSGGHERGPHQGPGHEGRADGPRRLRPRHLAGAHPGGRRHRLRPRHRQPGRRGRGHDHRRAGRGGDRGRDRARRPRGHGDPRLPRGPRPRERLGDPEALSRGRT